MTERDSGTPATTDESTMDEPAVDGGPAPETAAAIEEDAPVSAGPADVGEPGTVAAGEEDAPVEEDPPVGEDGPSVGAGSPAEDGSPASEAAVEEDPPVETEPVETEPVETEPIETEPIETEPVETEPIEADPIEAELEEAEPIEAEPIETEPIEVDPIEAELEEAEPIEAEPVEGEPADAEAVQADDEPGDDEAVRSAALSFEESAAAWVPPWARALPDLIIEPAADDPLPLRPAFVPEPEPEPEPEPDFEHAELADGDEPAAEPEPVVGTMEEGELRSSLEAIMLVVDEPVPEVLLAQVLEEPTDRVGATLRALAQEYTDTGRGFELRHAAGGWRLYTRAIYAPYVERFVLDGQQTRLTQAALETLAVVAYKQPVTRSRISAIRGVNCDGVLKTLVTRGLVEECGQEPDSGAFLYRTTSLFLEKLGINTVEELPNLAPFLPDNVDELDGVR